MQTKIEALFHPTTNNLTYLVQDPGSAKAAVIDTVLDFDPQSGSTTTTALDALSAIITERGLVLDWILETHPHADHLSGAKITQQRHGGTIAMGRGVTKVQETWKAIYNLKDEELDGSCFDHLFSDGESFEIGGLSARVMETPGHTPACVTYLIGDAAFVGDAIFMPDFGTARADFPGGDAHQLYHSTQRILDLAPQTRIFVGHDYGADGRDIAWETTVAAERAENKHVARGIDEAAFVKMRSERDRQLAVPNLLLPALQVNIRGGALPPAEDNGTRYMKIPLNSF